MNVYKILSLDEMEEYERTGEAPLSQADARDGYVHLSTGPQVPGTVEKHFAGLDVFRLLTVDPDRLGAALRWEPARGGELFPHLYGRLGKADVTGGWVLRRGHDGRFHFPGEITG